MDLQLLVARWALDEAPLPGKLLRELVEWLYREDRLCRGTLPVRGRAVGPGDFVVPTLAVVDTADELRRAPP
jgi:polyhydroxyalkanoate synthase subunit PhaC